MDANGQWVSLCLMIALVVVTIALDVWLAFHYGAHATFSRVLSHLFNRHPIVMAVAVFASGCVVGHVILPVYPR